MSFNPLSATTRRVSSGGGGRGIISITFHSSSLGNVPALSGAIDTYKILYSDNTVDYFQIQNGKDGNIPTIDIKSNNNQIVFTVSNEENIKTTTITTSDFSSIMVKKSMLDFPLTGEKNMLYLEQDTGRLYYYTSNRYVSVSCEYDIASSDDIKDFFN